MEERNRKVRTSFSAFPSHGFEDVRLAMPFPGSLPSFFSLDPANTSSVLPFRDFLGLHRVSLEFTGTR